VSPTTFFSDYLTTWSLAILPNIDQVNLYNLYNFNLDDIAPANQAVVQKSLPVYNCPSDINAGTVQAPASWSGAGASAGETWAMSSYRGMSGIPGQAVGGSTDAIGPDSNPYRRAWDDITTVVWNSAAPIKNRGMLHATGGYYPDPTNISASLGSVYSAWRGAPGVVKVQNVTDGLTNTLFVGEWHTKNNSNRGTFWGFTYTSYNLSAATPFGVTLMPDYANCSTVMTATVGDNNDCKRAWGSLHSSGSINFLLGDGSVRSISPNIDVTTTWLSLATIAGGEVIGDF
jgi:hypothetical protein